MPIQAKIALYGVLGAFMGLWWRGTFFRSFFRPFFPSFFPHPIFQKMEEKNFSKK
jgi:hypothetical protein